MAWFSRITRFGDLHMCFAQERNISCGVACVIMAAFKINKLTPGVDATFSESEILARATALFGPNPLGTAGFNNPQMVTLLNDSMLNMPGWALSRLPPAQVPQRIIDEVGVDGGFGPTVNVTPVIVGVDWHGGGGHWVLVDTVRRFFGNLYATVCDPWDGSVHVTKLKPGSSFAYTGEDVIDFDFWGKRFNYNSPSSGGALIGDIICR
ncbi:MAG: hypothetical protein NXI32_11945 [bacterium]|nr:hypothetical protein [bacterium]